MSDFGVFGPFFLVFHTHLTKVGKGRLLEHGCNDEQSWYISTALQFLSTFLRKLLKLRLQLNSYTVQQQLKVLLAQEMNRNREIYSLTSTYIYF